MYAISLSTPGDILFKASSLRDRTGVSADMLKEDIMEVASF
jgi:hypothetical protein